MFGLSLQGGSRPLLMAACWYTTLVCPTQDSTAVWQSTQWLDGTEQPITSSISKSCGPRRVNTHWQSQCLVTKSLKMQLSLSWKVDCPVWKYVLRVSNGQISWWQGMQSTNLCQKQNFLSLRTNLVPPSTYFSHLIFILKFNHLTFKDFSWEMSYRSNLKLLVMLEPARTFDLIRKNL